eukprot:gnl/Dysnectes_brevis/638_a705_6831.p1 GENE.gnl/Dysnectes_brevis/638_a705_6831~~gnl/Dysnectes_brevis/638_a705_6831.p1  ORF type:complete len:701 (+),score=394.84 gnl/Dysnectes_brevis/638_a705_6831:43-2145(+)
MAETFEFQAEITQLMNLIINTFYSSKEIFLRELISNASDALDKIHFKSLTDSDVLGEAKALEIKIIPKPEEKILIVRDTGVGMTKADLVECLGTIAKSGAKQFMEMLQEGADVSLIGQFGVGFYSAYLVAHTVEVITKHNDDECYRWASTAGGTFTIETIDRPDFQRGTEIILHLKEDQEEYLEVERVKELVKKHSQFIGYPIYLFETKEVTEEVTEEEEEAPEEKPEGEVEDAEESDDEEKEKKTKTITKTEEEFVHLNEQSAIWTRDPKEVTDKEYADFYKQMNPSDWEEHLAVSHFRVDGSVQFRGILYVPKRAPTDMWESHKKKSGVKLMVKKVFITDECTDLLPEWLSFVKGIIDCDDLPLNISREMLQHNRIVSTIKKNIVKKVLKLIKDLEEDEEKWEAFHKNFGKNIKLGIHEDSANREKLAKFLRFFTTKSGDKRSSLEDYITRMPEHQKHIYYITGDNRATLEKSPFIERFQKKGFEVVLMDESIDEYMISSLKEYEGKKLMCITKDGLELEATEEEKKKAEEDKERLSKLCSYMKEVLGEKVEGVRVSSDRLVSSPCILVTSEWGWSANMQRIMKAQALRDDSMSAVMMGKKTLEINPDNAIVKALAEKLDEDSENVYVRDVTSLLYDTAMLLSDFQLEDPSAFAKRIHAMVKVGLGAEDEEEEEEKDEMPPLEEGEESEEEEDVDEVD